MKLTAPLHRVTPLKRAPHVVKNVRDFARKTMNTEDVLRINTRLNMALWGNGIRSVLLNYYEALNIFVLSLLLVSTIAWAICINPSKTHKYSNAFLKFLADT